MALRAQGCSGPGRTAMKSTPIRLTTPFPASTSPTAWAVCCTAIR